MFNDVHLLFTVILPAGHAIAFFLLDDPPFIPPRASSASQADPSQKVDLPRPREGGTAAPPDRWFWTAKSIVSCGKIPSFDW